MPLSLEQVLRDLHDSEISAGCQTFYDAGLRVWLGENMNDVKASATFNRDASHQWPAEDAAAQWLHQTALNLYPNSRYAKHQA